MLLSVQMLSGALCHDLRRSPLRLYVVTIFCATTRFAQRLTRFELNIMAECNPRFVFFRALPPIPCSSVFPRCSFCAGDAVDTTRSTGYAATREL